MSAACDGVTTYQSGGAGGKLRKKPIRRNSPYNRLPIRNNQPSLFSKLMNPASRLIYAGADRLFSVFRKRLPSIPVQSLPGTPSMVPFKFGGQTSQPQTSSQNPFQASAGSFSLGSGGSVKSDRRILKVKRLNRNK